VSRWPAGMLFGADGEPIRPRPEPTGEGWEWVSKQRHTMRGQILSQYWQTLIRWKAPEDFKPGPHEISWDADHHNARIRVMLKFPHGLFEPQRAKGYSRSNGSRVVNLTRGFQEKGEVWLQFQPLDSDSNADVFSSKLRVTPVEAA